MKLAAWTPQTGPQSEAIAATWCAELFFGGARGGGKSDFLLGDFLQDVRQFKTHWRGILFRQTTKELEELVRRSQEIFPATGGTWFEQKHMWVWPEGATLKMRHLEIPSDADLYQGHQYTWIGFDELTQWPSPECYQKLRACLRCASADIPTKRIRASGNPGGPGHQWVKSMFIDYCPLGNIPFRDEITKQWRMFIPSHVEDNKILLLRDPQYIDRLRGVGSPELVRAWLEGDWTAVMGAYFPEFSPRHIIKPFAVPPYWTRFRAFDWGSAAPFSVGWFAVSDGSNPLYPDGALIQYREWYGASGPNVGLRLKTEDVAKGILAREMPSENITYGTADTQIFAEDGGPSIAEVFKNNGVSWRAADKKRIPGWQQIRSRLVGVEDRPMLFFFSTCSASIRIIPALQHDTKNPEDVDTEGDDHAGDMVRYACTSRPFRTVSPQKKPLLGLSAMTFDDAVQSEKDFNSVRKRYG